jgi:mono/diheme cytochrome c family protein
VLGDPDNSLLIKVVRHEIEDLEMPQDGTPLTAREIEGLAEWIRMDAPWPEDGAEIVFAATTASAGLSPGARIFVDRVRPVIEQRCLACHGEDERGGLRLDSRERVLQGGGRGPAVIPGNPEQSLLVAVLRHVNDDLQMPRNADPLSDREIEGFVEWIRAGAEWAETEAPIALPRRAITEEERRFWSFRPLSKPEVPTPNTEGWAQTAVDRFVLAMLERQSLMPVAAADERQLIRRATYDLTGLPPTPEEIDAYLGDDAPDSFERVVDRLLASDHYGERWARHWLDVTRFGEDDTRGLAPDKSGRERYPMAYVHRDWVVEAFNDDMPYDRFVKAHLAADLMPDSLREELLPGLGFLGQGPWYYDIVEPATARADERHGRVDVASRGFLGLTVGCARCHDHKYDPIGTHDYYSWAGIFDNAIYYEYPLAGEKEAEQFKKDQEFIKDMKKGLGEYLSTEAKQLSQVLSLQTSAYMMAAWKVTGKEQLPVETASI